MIDAHSVSTSSLGLVKMEERKRVAITDPEDALPLIKKQATVSNAIKTEDGAAEWDPMVQEYQKDAILRNYKLLKKEKEEVEARLQRLVDKGLYHDDHIRLVDVWLRQFLDEIRVYVSDLDTLGSHDATFHISSFNTPDEVEFNNHLSTYAEEFMASMRAVRSKIPPAPPDAQKLQQELSDALAKRHEYQASLERLLQEKIQLDEQVLDQTWRAMKAEKKLERDKSKVFSKVFQNDGRSMSLVTADVKAEPQLATNGALPSPVLDEHMEAERQSAIAVAEKRREQVSQLEVANRKLTEAVTTLNVRLSGLCDDDYAKTDLFKEMKSRFEDVVKRVNHLEATNVELREEAQKLQAERTAYRMQIDDESRKMVAEAESELAKTESDLTRVREARDEAKTQLTILQETTQAKQTTMAQLQELAASSEGRVRALESEVERLSIRGGEVEAEPAPGVDSMSAEELRRKVSSLSKENAMFGQELAGMALAWRKAQALAKRNVDDIVDMERQLQKFSSEREKAFQKFYSLAKTKEAVTAENTALRAQNSKSSGIVTQLKEAEISSKGLLTLMERQLAEAKEVQTSTAAQLRELQQKVTSYTISSEGLTAQTLALKKLLAVRDSEITNGAHAMRELEVEFEQIKAKLMEAKKTADDWRVKASGKQSDSDEMLRRIAYCSCCKINLKDTLIKKCNHIHCSDCVQMRIKNRDRRCPHCNLSFGTSDVCKVVLNL